eukprot:GGOE01001252.1.p1 GENE.GGOE01001252.1~~GGOE01001252.1.p1  ORF type:complete len:497 (-),score=63.59 GGOE01001252.1:235-1701(-)
MTDLLLQLVSFVNKWALFHQPHKVDFCTHNLSALFPLHWATAMVDDGELGLETLIQAVLFGSTPESWPGDLKEFVATAIQMRPQGCNNIQALSFDHCWEKGTGPKKLHEVKQMAWCVQQVAQASGCSHIMEVGAGKGHLSNALAHHPELGYSVCALDCNESSLAQLEKRGKHSEVSKLSSGRLHVLVARLPGPISTVRGSANMAVQHLQHLERAAFPSSPSAAGVLSVPFTICGLHCCGGLSSSTLSAFLHMEAASALCLVGCCYNLLAPDNREELSTIDNDKLSLSSSDPVGNYFPMSNALHGDHPVIGVTRNTLMLACQNVAAASQLLAPDALRIMRYRAVFQDLLLRELHINPLRRRIALKGDASSTTFGEYSSAMLHSMNLMDKLVAEGHWVGDTAARQRFYEKHAPALRLLPAFLAVQLLLCPVIERLIAEDRVCYLRENGAFATALPIFHADISPRNLCLFAAKDPMIWTAIEVALGPMQPC